MTTTFRDYDQNTPVMASWLNEVDRNIFGPTGSPGTLRDDVANGVMGSYAQLRAYSGGVTAVRISANGIAGIFQLDSSDLSSADNGGTILVGAAGRRWKRVYSGDILAEWFGIQPDGNDWSTAAQVALNLAVASGVWLVFGAGTYTLSSMVAATYPTAVRIRGSGKQATKLVGATGRTLFKLSAGAATSLRDIGFVTWQVVGKLLSNVGLAAYGILEVDSCYFENIDISSLSDNATPADGGILEVRFTRCTVLNCGRANSVNSAALRLDSSLIYSAYVHDNEVNGIGGATYSGQKDGFSLGAVTTDALCTLVVSDNRIYNVGTSGTAHVSGITVFGPRTKVSGNTIINVYGSSTNADQYGIYTKSSYGTITENTLLNAGGKAACIMTKGYPNDLNPPSLNAADNNNVIADNTITVTTRANPSMKYTGIVTYNGGMNIHDNILVGMNEGIIEIGIVSATYGLRAGNVIHHNTIDGLLGVAGSSVIGITSNSPNGTVIEHNTMGMKLGIGTGVEASVKGVSITVAGAYVLTGLFLQDNKVSHVAAATTAAARAYDVSFAFTGGGAFDQCYIKRNWASNAGYGIVLAFDTGVTSFECSENDMNICSVAPYQRSGGTIPLTGPWGGNKIDGADFSTLADGATVPSTFAMSHLRTANTSATVIAGIADGAGNQELLLEVNDNFTTVHVSATVKLSAAGAFAPANGGMIRFKRMGGVFKELSRTSY